MSFDIIPKSPFPDVPNLPGVPLLARAALTVIVDVTTAINIARVFAPQAPLTTLFHATKAKPVWGVFNAAGTQRVINPDNIMTFDYRAEWTVSDFPVQSGQFSSYNKVAHPFDTAVRMTKGGTQSDRTAFLTACETVAASLNLFTILTPEKSFPSVNVTRLEYARKETRGAFYLEVDLFFRQIAEVDAQYSSSGTQATSTANAQTAPAVPTVNQGNVQAMPPTAQTQASVISKLTTGM